MRRGKTGPSVDGRWPRLRSDLFPASVRHPEAANNLIYAVAEIHLSAQSK